MTLSIPTLSSVGEFAAADAKLDAIRKKHRDAEQRCEQLQYAINTWTTAPPAGAVNEAKNALEEAAHALLAGDDDAASVGDVLASNRERLKEVQSEMRVTGRAVELADMRQKKAAVDASKKICAHIAPEVEKLIDNLLVTLLSAVAANEALREVYDQLNQADIRWVAYLPPTAFNRLGRIDETTGPIGIWVRGLIESGYSPAKIIKAAPDAIKGDIRRIVGSLREMGVTGHA